MTPTPIADKTSEVLAAVFVALFFTAVVIVLIAWTWVLVAAGVRVGLDIWRGA